MSITDLQLVDDAYIDKMFKSELDCNDGKGGGMPCHVRLLCISPSFPDQLLIDLRFSAWDVGFKRSVM
jgi:hypothetical protein